MTEKLKVLDLFSGIGGFSLGLERTGGFETAAFCEIEEFPRKVLAKHWPEVPIFQDVRELTGEQVGAVDVICGGYPCQPFSTAGKRRGQKDDRHLWPEFSRLVAELRPTWVIGENVAGHISMGLDDVLSDLEGQGYACRTFVIPACAVGAPHRRDRCWTIAHADNFLHQRKLVDGGNPSQAGRSEGQHQSEGQAPFGKRLWAELGASGPDVADTEKLQRNVGGEYQESSERQVPEPGVGSSEADMADALRKYEQRQQPGVANAKEWAKPGERQVGPCNYGVRSWPPEPGVGVFTDGVPEGLDRIRGLRNANAAKKRASEILSNLPEGIAEKAFQRASGRLRGVSEAQVLLAWLHGVQEREDGGRLAASCEEAEEEIVRSVWHTIETASASHKSRHNGQQTGEYPNSLRELSRGTPSQFQAAWAGGFWEDGTPRVANGVPDRVERLKALGNAVVPQIPEMIGRAILEAEGMTCR